jgi:hypothetical protein
LGTNIASEPKTALEDYLPLVRFLAESIQIGLRQESDDGIQWRPQFMRHGGQESGFQPVCGLRAIPGFSQRLGPLGKKRSETP